MDAQDWVSIVALAIFVIAVIYVSTMTNRRVDRLAQRVGDIAASQRRMLDYESEQRRVREAALRKPVQPSALSELEPKWIRERPVPPAPPWWRPRPTASSRSEGRRRQDTGSAPSVVDVPTIDSSPSDGGGGCAVGAAD